MLKPPRHAPQLKSRKYPQLLITRLQAVAQDRLFSLDICQQTNIPQLSSTPLHTDSFHALPPRTPTLSPSATPSMAIIKETAAVKRTPIASVLPFQLSQPRSLAIALTHRNNRRPNVHHHPLRHRSFNGLRLAGNLHHLFTVASFPPQRLNQFHHFLLPGCKKNLVFSPRQQSNYIDYSH